MVAADERSAPKAPVATRAVTHRFAASARLDSIAAEDRHPSVDVSVGDACAAINPVKANYRRCFDVVEIR